jgi:hypothetical protein
MSHDASPGFQRIHLERLKLAVDVILSEAEAISDALEAELTIYRDRLEHALLLPAPTGQAGG